MKASVFWGLCAASVLGLSSIAEAGPNSAHYARGNEGVFWFMHLSDSHIGAEFYESSWSSDSLRFALNEGVKVIRPTFVMASGDLTDGSKLHVPMTGQSQQEWDLYKEIYKQAGMTSDFYFDLPGNHDAVGDKGLTYYLANSLQGSVNKRLYVDWTVKTSVGEYYFFGLNSNSDYFKPLSNCCPAFTADEIAELKSGLESHKKSQLVFVAAHHAFTPDGSVAVPLNTDEVRDAIKGAGGFYLHGDLHAYKEYLDHEIVVNEVNSLGKSKKENIGVGIVDHNAFIYRATGYEGTWPFVVVTAPVSAKLKNDEKNPHAYSVCKDRKDNPVRAMVFSKEVPSKVEVTVGSLSAVKMTESKDVEGLWQAEIDTSSLAVGESNLTVRATAGATSNSHKIPVTFVAGPCEDLPGALVDAGVVDASSDASSDASDSSAKADSAEAGGDSAKDAVSELGKDSGDSGVQVNVDEPSADESGCSCRTAKQRETTGELSLVFGLLGLIGLRRKKRSKRS